MGRILPVSLISASSTTLVLPICCAADVINLGNSASSVSQPENTKQNSARSKLNLFIFKNKKSDYNSLNPDTPPETMNFIAEGPDIWIGFTLVFGTRK